MQRLNVRNTLDEIYRQFEQEAALAERLGEANPLAVMNWFSGDDVPDFEQADRLATYLGCSARWLKFGEGRPFAFGSPRRLNGHGSAYDDARALLTPEAAGNPVYKISIIRDDFPEGISSSCVSSATACRRRPSGPT